MGGREEATGIEGDRGVVIRGDEEGRDQGRVRRAMKEGGSDANGAMMGRRERCQGGVRGASTLVRKTTSEAIRGNQRQSAAIRGNQRLSHLGEEDDVSEHRELGLLQQQVGDVARVVERQDVGVRG